jgi:predicted permease
MSAWDAVRHRLRVWLRRGAWERELEEELRFHQVLEAMQQEHAGASPEAARAAARRRLGSPAYYREETRRVSGLPWVESLMQDLRFVARSLRREPGFATFVVLTLALGIGANAAMFGVVDRLLLRGPEHVRDQRRVVRLYLTDHPPGLGEYTTGTLGYVSFEVLREGAHAFEDLAVYNRNQVTMDRGAAARQLAASYVSASFFPLLGVTPALGRFFSAREDATGGAEHVAVISHDLWKGSFAGDPAVLGRTLLIGDEPFTVVGVAPEGFTGAELQRVDLWLPMSVLGPRVTDDWTHAWNAQWLRVIGRLKAGVSFEQAAAEATGVHGRAYGNTPSGSFTPAARLSVRPLSADEGGDEPAENAVSRWLVGVTLIVLLIACANVTNLLLARGARRRREVTVRLALGVGRWRLVRLLLSEALLLAVAGSLAGLVVAYLAAGLLRRALPPTIAWFSAPVDGRVLAAAAGLAILTGLAIGLVPALRATRSDVAGGLKAGAREGGGRRSRLRMALTVTQAALSVVLLVGAGLFVRSLWNVGSLELGLEPDRVLAVDVEMPGLGRITDPAARERARARRNLFFADALERVRRLPGVEHAALTIGMPFQSWFSVRLRLPGRDSLPRLPTGGPNITAVTAEYFATMGTRLLRGRVFTEQDRAGSERVAIVNNTMARTYWPGRDPLGECLLIQDQPCARIVGVVADARRYRLREDPHMHYYVPRGQETSIGGTTLLVRPVTGDAEALAEPVRRALLELDPGLGYVQAQSVQEIIDPQVRPWKLGVSVFGLAGVLALVVAAVGLYSVLSYLVEQRTQELGVRIALGARAGSIVRLVLRDSLAMTLLGIAAGAALALVAGRFLQALLFETSARDPVVLVTVAASLILVAVLASVLPALRANGVDPMEALRAE